MGLQAALSSFFGMLLGPARCLLAEDLPPLQNFSFELFLPLRLTLFGGPQADLPPLGEPQGEPADKAVEKLMPRFGSLKWASLLSAEAQLMI